MRLMKLTYLGGDKFYLNPLEIEGVDEVNKLDKHENIVGEITEIRLRSGNGFAYRVRETKEQVAEEWETCMIQNCDCRM